MGKTGDNDGGRKSDGGSRGNLKTETIWDGRRDCYSPPFAVGLVVVSWNPVSRDKDVANYEIRNGEG